MIETIILLDLDSENVIIQERFPEEVLLIGFRLFTFLYPLKWKKNNPPIYYEIFPSSVGTSPLSSGIVFLLS